MEVTLFQRLSIRSKIAVALVGVALLAFVLAAVAFALYESFTLEHRARQIMEPYAQLVSVGAEAAVAFQDPGRAQEILNTLRANPQILDAEIFLEDGRLLARYNSSKATYARHPLKPAGIYLKDDTAELVQSLQDGAHLHIVISLYMLNRQTRDVLQVFASWVLVLLVAVTLGLRAVLQRTIVRPISTLTEIAEQVRTRADYHQRVPVSGADEVGRLGQSFNAMMGVVQERNNDLHRLTFFQRTILDNAAYGIISTAPDGIVSSFNPAAERLLGYTADEVIGKQTPVCWHDPEEMARRALQLSEELGETISPGFDVFAARPRRNLPEQNEWTFICKDGTAVPVLLSVTALRSESGQITGFVGLTYDITERKRLEEALQKLNRELRAISNCNQILVRAEDEQVLLNDICRIICDEAGYRLAWVGYAEHDDAKTVRPVAWGGFDSGYVANAKLSWANDTERGRGPGGTCIQSGEIVYIQNFITDPQMAPWREDALQRGYRSGIALPLKDEYANVFGVLLIYSSELNAFTPDEICLLEQLSGDLAFGIMVLRGRIERKRVENELRFRNLLLSTQQEVSIDGILVVDENGKMISSNQRFVEIWEISSEVIESKSDGRALQEMLDKLVEPEQFLHKVQYLYEHRHEKSREEIELKDGRTFDRYSAPMFGPGDKYYGRVWFFRDITDHKKLEDQLRHSQKMEAVGTLAGGIAHDFNNILNVIIGYGTMVLDRLKDDPLSKEQLNEVLAAADRAANLTKRLLTFSRKHVLEKKPVNVNEAIINMEKMLSRIIGEDIAFTMELASRKMIVMADAGQIEQVLMNLITNAKYVMQKGGRLTISTGTKEMDEEYIAAYGYGKAGTYALISVADTGSGIDAETQKKIFEPFFTTKGVGEGTGLGLSIAYGIIKQHDGYINVYSEPGKGTEFKIYLPLIAEETAKGPEVGADAPIKGGTETILLAEDDASLRQLSRIVLESYGYTIITVEDGEEAITRYMENMEKIRLVILDMIMPKKSGKEAYSEIKKIKPDIKALFVSGYTIDVINKKELLDEGIDIILKPVSPKDLVKKVREVLDR